MRARSKTPRTEQLPALTTTLLWVGPTLVITMILSSVMVVSLLIVMNLLVVYLITREVHKRHLGKNLLHIRSESTILSHNCKLCSKFNLSHIFVSSSTNRNYEITVPSHISIESCATYLLNYLQKLSHLACWRNRPNIKKSL